MYSVADFHLFKFYLKLSRIAFLLSLGLFLFLVTFYLTLKNITLLLKKSGEKDGCKRLGNSMKRFNY